MRRKKGVRIFIIYILALMILPINIGVKQINAFETEEHNNYSFKQYNSSSTFMTNKYNVEGEIIWVKQLKEYSTVLTDKGLYFIKNGQVIKYKLSSVSYNSQLNMVGNYIYFTTYNKDNYSLLKLDPKTNSIENINFEEEKLRFDNYNSILIESNIDHSGSSWFSVLEYDRDKNYEEADFKEYKLLRRNEKGQIKEFCKLENIKGAYYKDAFTDMKFDHKNNIWFKVSQISYDNKNDVFKLGRIDVEGEVSYFNFKSYIKSYCITPKGELWIISGENSILHLDNEGYVLERMEIKNVLDITSDEEGHIWILHDNKIKKLENKSFEIKYEIKEEINRLSVLNDEKIIAAGSNAFVIIDGIKSEEIDVGSYIYDSAFVTKDDKGNIYVLSTEKDNWDIMEEHRNYNLAITELFKNGKFEKESLKDGKYLPYEGAKIYKGNMYIPVDNSVYRISNGEVEEKIEICSKKYPVTCQRENLTDIEFDNNENMYIMSERKIYMLSDKNIQSFGIDEITKDLNSKDFKIFKRLIKDKEGNVYAVVKTDENEFAYKLNTFSEIKQVHEFLLKRNNREFYPVNTFIDDKGYLEVVYYIEGNYLVYKLIDGKLKMDERFENQPKNITEGLNTISKVISTGEGSLFMVMHGNSLYIKYENHKYFYEVEDFQYKYTINSIEASEDGGVYIGTYDNGVLYYKPCSH